MVTQIELDKWFTYHVPGSVQIAAYTEIRDEAKRFAEILIRVTPPSADQTSAIRKLREVVMTANAAIACGS